MGEWKKAGNSIRARPHYCELNRDILAAVNELVYFVESDEYLRYIPETAVCPSPRYLQQLILDFVLQSGQDSITKRESY